MPTTRNQRTTFNVCVSLPRDLERHINKAVKRRVFGVPSGRHIRCNRSMVLAGCLREVLGLPHPEGTLTPKE